MTVNESAEKLVRGETIKRRRLALALRSVSEFHRASGFSRDMLTAAENGSASARSYDVVEEWLDRMEASGGARPPADAAVMRVHLRDVFGVGEVEVIFEGDTEPEDLTAKMQALISGLRQGGAPQAD